MPDAVSPNSSARFVPHPPTADRFADSWYCYLHDPGFGFLKVAFLTYLNDRTDDGVQHGYVHLVHAPVDGPTREWDHWSRAVVSEAVPERGPDAFRFEIPGVATIDETVLSVTLPDAEARIELTGPPVRYFPEPDPAASPFMGPLPELPSEQSHWFVQTLGTPASSTWRDDDGERSGSGLLYAERGWSVRQAHGFCYLVAISDAAKVVLTCGMPDDDHEVWAGRVLTADHDLTFLPFAGDIAVSSMVTSDEGRAEIRFTQGSIEVRVTAQAPLGDFYDQITPSLTVFGAEHPVAKTMDARFTLEIRVDGSVVETHDLPQSILEFGGVLYPTELEGLTERPTYRYAD